MITVRIQHQVHDYEQWKVAFDRDPVGREQSGVRSYRISRPVDDPNDIQIDLDFDEMQQAEAFLESMRRVWQLPQATAALKSGPSTRVVEVAESHTF